MFRRARVHQLVVNCSLPLRPPRGAHLWSCWQHLAARSIVHQEFRKTSLYEGLIIKWVNSY